MIVQSIFKAYDIRGTVDTELTPESVELIGKALGTYSLRQGEKEFVIGRDGRLSGAWIRDSLIKGIISTGCFVVDIGMVASPMTYFATKTTSANSAVMITGSHNPPEYNGFKIIINSTTISGEQIQELYQLIIAGDFEEGNGLKTNADINENYYNRITSDITLAKPLKVVIDCGNGVASDFAPELYTRLGAELEELYCTIDGNFPNHHPDPSHPKNLEDIIAQVVQTGADIGLAFDGDGDRLGVIDNEGNIIWADRQMMLYAEHILREQRGKIVFDVKCTAHLPKHITKCGGTPIMSRTGHSFIKKTIYEEQALLGGEMSGHIFFNDRWYGFDDALYTGARLLEILAQTSQTSSELFAALPNSVNTPEINIKFDQQGEQFKVMDTLTSQMSFPNGEVNTIDGVRVDYPYGFGLVRPSNTTPCLVLRFEADTKEHLESIISEFANWLDSHHIPHPLS